MGVMKLSLIGEKLNREGKGISERTILRSKRGEE